MLIGRNQKTKNPNKPVPSSQRTRKGAAQQDRRLSDNKLLSSRHTVYGSNLGASKAQVRTWTSLSRGCEEVTTVPPGGIREGQVDSRDFDLHWLVLVKTKWGAGTPPPPGAEEASLLSPLGWLSEEALQRVRLSPPPSKGVPSPPLGSVEVRWEQSESKKALPHLPAREASAEAQRAARTPTPPVTSSDKDTPTLGVSGG